MSEPGDDPSRAVRLDVWLDISCLFKTRSEAQRACRGGKVAVNGVAAKPHRLLHSGDRLRISRPQGRVQEIVVLDLADHNLAKAEARRLYDDRTPPLSPEERERRYFERQYRAAVPQARPDKRGRRELRRLKGRI